MVFRSTVASHPPLSGYSAPEGYFPAQRLGGSQSNRVLTGPGTKKETDESVSFRVPSRIRTDDIQNHNLTL